MREASIAGISRLPQKMSGKIKHFLSILKQELFIVD